METVKELKNKIEEETLTLSMMINCASISSNALIKIEKILNMY